MFKSNSPSVQAFSIRRVRLPPLSVEVIDCKIIGNISDFMLEPIDKFPVGVIPSRSFEILDQGGKLRTLCRIIMRANVAFFHQLKMQFWKKPFVPNDRPLSKSWSEETKAEPSQHRKQDRQNRP